MDGLTLAALVRDGWPPVVIMIASGIIGVEKSAMPKGSMFFPKPYSTGQITRTMRDIARRLGHEA